MAARRSLIDSFQITMPQGSKVGLGLAKSNEFRQVGIASNQGQMTSPFQSSSVGDRGIISGGHTTAAYVTTIDCVNISVLSNAATFGQATTDMYGRGATSNSSYDRGVFGGGYKYNEAFTNIIDYITISSPSNASDFGDLIVARGFVASTSNGINNRGIFAGGNATATNTAAINTIEYITISNVTNAFDFGDLSTELLGYAAASNSINNIGIINGGSNRIDSIRISSLSNSKFFGNLTSVRWNGAGLDNGVNDRAIFSGGWINTPSVVAFNYMDYATISTPSNGTDFGDLTVARSDLESTSNGTNNRGIIVGGLNSVNSVSYNIIDYINISVLGNAFDFGDLTQVRHNLCATSNA